VLTERASTVTEERATAASRLRDVLAPEFSGEIRTDAYSRHLYSSDASMYAIEPIAVAFPRSTQDIAAAVSAAGSLEIPLLARGAGTSLAGQTVGPGLILDVSRHMGAILDVDPTARVARVQPGVVQESLNRAVRTHGLMFGADTSTSNRATLGGMIGNNSAGSQSRRYGMTIDHVRALDVVLSNGRTAHLASLTESDWQARRGLAGLEGEIHRELPRIAAEHRDAIAANVSPFWRHAGGYRLDRLVDGDGLPNLATFVVGSESTLVIVTEAELDLVRCPQAQSIAVGHFRSAAEAIEASADALARDATAVELLDHTILSLARTKLQYRAAMELLDGDPGALLFVSFDGETSRETDSAVQGLAADWQLHGHGYRTILASDPAEREALLSMRRSSLGLLMAASTGTRRPLAFVEDTAVPPELLSGYVAEFSEVLDRHGLRAGFYGHCAVGCLHIRPFVDLRDAAEITTMREVAEEIVALVTRFGGVNSSEHGDGLARSEFNRELFGDEAYEAMREVKRLFDPHGILNPGKIVDAGPMTDHLRDALMPVAQPLHTRLRFDGEMRGAADRCMNIGACRKSGSGVMCPSYIATGEEEHSTRGRANALVKALSASDPHAALGDERLHGIMDLCLSCKACKTECPLGVDMASLKSEYLFQYQSIHGVPLRSRVFADIRSVNQLAARVAPVVNLINRVRPLRGMLDRGLGITRERPLPTVHRETLVRWFHRRRPTSGTSVRGDVAFMADSFTTFSEPEIGRACIELLEAAGWRIHLVSSGCCGRSSLSKGLLDRARRQATGLIDGLWPLVSQGALVVGCEPSCLLTLRDELSQLLPDDDRVRVIADRAHLVADLLVEAIEDGGLSLDPASEVANRRIVFHGHCHEKAVTGTKASVELLRRIPGAQVQELDAGCCGMAGSFGFESEHYDISMTIGEDRLFPAVRAAPAETLIAATGVSCRQQIYHGTGRIARHPVELVRMGVDREVNGR
jgi:FAD/FMN-containing dehydrogenase/Fe-S oxidoreductase